MGCGNISDIYLSNLTSLFHNVSIYACADLDGEKVRKAAEKYAIPHIMTFEEMLECQEINLILNLTTPGSHYSLSRRALLKGKHVYVEKPLATAEHCEYQSQPLISPYYENSRGLGLAEMVHASGEGRIHNASGALALHVLEIMESLKKSARLGTLVQLESRPSREVPLDWNVRKGEINTK